MKASYTQAVQGLSVALVTPGYSPSFVGVVIKIAECKYVQEPKLNILAEGPASPD